MLASSYPLLDAFWTILWIFCFMLWIWLVIFIFMDIFRSPDLSGWGKAIWSIFIIFLPFIGVLAYLIARGGKMREHSEREAAQQDAAFKEYVRQTAADATSPADEDAKLADLRDRNVITQEEFESAKANLLGTGS
jgi:hypothetical protein